MLTAAVSSIVGLVSGFAPKLVKEFTDSRSHKREMESLRLQTELQLKIAEKEGNTRVAEMDRKIEIAAYDAQAGIAKASLRKTGIKFVDAWNGVLRPFTVTLIILLFVGMSTAYSYAVFSAVETLADIRGAVELLWGSLIGEAIQAVLGFLFGYRSGRKL